MLKSSSTRLLTVLLKGLVKKYLVSSLDEAINTGLTTLIKCGNLLT